MITPAHLQRAVPATQHLVYTRRRADGALPIDGKRDGWKLDDNLLCDRIGMVEGPHPATAHFTFVPRNNSQYRVEFALNRYKSDDQVKVVMLALDDELIEAPSAEDEGVILFEGFITRSKWGIQTSDNQSDEGVGFVADALPLLDDVHPDHLITGRWLFDREDETVASGNQPFIVHSPSLPAVFNHQGRPNMSRHKIGGGLIAGEVTAAHVFTHDDDPAGRHWTVRAALASIILQWVFSPQLRIEPDGTEHTILDYKAFDRHICIDRQLMAELGRGIDAAALLPMHEGLEKILPELSVHGLGALSAIDAVCQAAGFKMAIEPIQDSQFSSEDGLDRRYRLRVWQRNRGRGRVMWLATAGSEPPVPEFLFRDNNIHGVQAIEDSREIVNEVVAVGESIIEATIELKPGWAPGDVDPATVNHTLRSKMPILLTGSGYHAKHIHEGRLFAQYGHVGRMWVVDCVGDPFGDAGTDIASYASGVYKHEDQGFDFPEALGLDLTANAIEQERASAGLADPTIRWSNRLRRALPLRSPAAQALGREYYLEVSEDGGSTWSRLDRKLYSTLRDQFGIFITGAPNLAEVNLASMAGGRVPNVAASWWALIQNELLLLRITCAIKTDHAAIAIAPRQTTSGSIYKRAQLVVARGAEEVWQAPSTPVNETTEYRKVLGWGGQNALAAGLGDKVKSYQRTLGDIAEQRRDALQTRRGRYTFSQYLWSYGQNQLGDAITQIKGRDIPLSTNSGEAAAYPTVVAIDLVLSPGKEQGVTLTCEDHILRGRGGGR